MTSADLLASDFATLPDLVRAHAGERPDAVAAADPVRRLSWSELDRMVDRIAARLQQDGFAKGDRTAIVGLNSVEQVEAILGTLRAGGVAGLVTNRDRKTTRLNPVPNAHLVTRPVLRK